MGRGCAPWPDALGVARVTKAEPRKKPCRSPRLTTSRSRLSKNSSAMNRFRPLGADGATCVIGAADNLAQHTRHHDRVRAEGEGRIMVLGKSHPVETELVGATELVESGPRRPAVSRE